MKSYKLLLIMSALLPLSAQGPDAIYTAAQKGTQALLNVLKKASVNSTDDYGRTALLIAAQKGDEPSVRLLLEYKADPNVIPFMTPLIAATKIGQAGIVKALLAYGAQSTAADMWEKTALDYAKEGGWAAITQMLTSHNAGPSQTVQRVELSIEPDFIDTDLLERECTICKDADTEDNPLVPVPCSAQHEFHAHCIDYWKTLSGSCPLCKDYIQATAYTIFQTAKKGSDTLQAHLSKFNASVDSQDNEGLTALMIAAREGDNAAVKVLLAHHARTDTVSLTGKTALCYAQERGHYIAALEKRPNR